MPSRAGPRVVGRPAGFDQAGLEQSAQDRVERSRGQPVVRDSAYPWCHPAGSSTKAARAAWVCGEAKRGRGIPKVYLTRPRMPARGPGTAPPWLRPPGLLPSTLPTSTGPSNHPRRKGSTSAPAYRRARPEVATPPGKADARCGAYLSTGLSRYPPQPVDPCDGTARASERNGHDLPDDPRHAVRARAPGRATALALPPAWLLAGHPPAGRPAEPLPRAALRAALSDRPDGRIIPSMPLRDTGLVGRDADLERLRTALGLEDEGQRSTQSGAVRASATPGRARGQRRDRQVAPGARPRPRMRPSGVGSSRSATASGRPAAPWRTCPSSR